MDYTQQDRKPKTDVREADGNGPVPKGELQECPCESDRPRTGKHGHNHHPTRGDLPRMTLIGETKRVGGRAASESARNQRPSEGKEQGTD